MRPPDRTGLCGILLVALLAASCSRFTFIRPKGEVRPMKSAAPAYEVRDSDATRQRMAEQQQMALAGQRLQSGDLDAAETEARKVLKTRPDSADAHTLLAVVASRRGQAKAAGEYYRRAAELAPRQGGALNNYGAWLCANGFAAESLVWFDRALSAPGYAQPESAMANAGGCALMSGQYERAERDLRNALSLDPTNAYALAAMARNEHRLGRDFQARAFIERRLAAASADASVLQLAADIETRLGDTAAAGRYLQRLRAEFPGTGAATSGDSARP